MRALVNVVFDVVETTGVINILFKVSNIEEFDVNSILLQSFITVITGRHNKYKCHTGAQGPV